MKNKFLTIAVFFVLLFSINTNALKKFGYRGVAFDSNGEILGKQSISLTIEIIKSGAVVYKETHSNVQTNQFGAYKVVVGNGSVVTGVFRTVTVSKDIQIKSTINGGGVWVVSSILKPITPITDFDDKSDTSNIESVTIGTQIWSKKNLDIVTYRNGDPIPQVTNPTDWSNLTTGAWCYYNNEESNNDTYGKLYNWYAVNDPRGLAPAGWHIPTDDEWKTLEIELGMTRTQTDAIGWRGTDEGSKLAGNAALWNDGALEINPNFGASGFDCLPGGYRAFNGVFNSIRWFAYCWTSSEFNATIAWNRHLYCYRTAVYRGNNEYKKTGLSVRLVKD